MSFKLLVWLRQVDDDDVGAIHILRQDLLHQDRSVQVGENSSETKAQKGENVISAPDHVLSQISR